VSKMIQEVLHWSPNPNWNCYNEILRDAQPRNHETQIVSCTTQSIFHPNPNPNNQSITIGMKLLCQNLWNIVSGWVWALLPQIWGLFNRDKSEFVQKIGRVNQYQTKHCRMLKSHCRPMDFEIYQEISVKMMSHSLLVKRAIIVYHFLLDQFPLEFVVSNECFHRSRIWDLSLEAEDQTNAFEPMLHIYDGSSYRTCKNIWFFKSIFVELGNWELYEQLHRHCWEDLTGLNVHNRVEFLFSSNESRGYEYEIEFCSSQLHEIERNRSCFLLIASIASMISNSSLRFKADESLYEMISVSETEDSQFPHFIVGFELNICP
jgi:hypothetical protein